MAIDRYGILPPVIRANAELDEAVDRSMRAAASIAKALRALDPRLELQYFEEKARPRNVCGQVIPGRWHVVRRNDPPAPDWPYPIVTEDGGYREPDSGVILEMQRRDLQRNGLPDPEPKRSDPNKEARVEEMASDIRAAKRVAGDGGMTRRRFGRG